jgi:hypothetical protein
MNAKRGIALALLIAAAGCSDHRHYYFVGRVYDGVTGARLTNYKIQLQWLDHENDGTVDGEGRYFIGPLDPFDDYSIEIRADGYRSFLSHNMMLADDDPKVDHSFYYDAYLFPTNLVSPAVTFRISLSDSMMPPSGSIRLRPTTGSSLDSGTTNMPAGVGSQVWANSDDLQFNTVQRDFQNGEADFMQGDLVYGVKYAVTVYNIPGHQDATSTYQSGKDGDQAIIVLPLTATPLMVAFLSTSLGQITPSGELVIVFNEPAEFDPLNTPDTYRLALDNGFSITSPDKNMNGMTNTLKPGGMRGVMMTLEGSKLTFDWNPSTALMTTDPGDPITAVTWGGLAGVQLRPQGGDASTSTSLAAIVGSASVTVNTAAP